MRLQLEFEGECPTSRQQTDANPSSTLWELRRLPKRMVLPSLCGMIVATLAVYGLYQTGSNALYQLIRDHARSLAVTAAQSVDPGTHARLLSLEDEGSEAYADLAGQMRAIKRANPEIRYLYTLVRTDNPKIWQFVVDSETDARQRYHIGDTLDASPFPELWEAWARPVVDRGFFEDAWGTWLSAYAPIRGKDGTTVAVLALDVSSNWILARQSFFRTASVAACLIIYLLIVLAALSLAQKNRALDKLVAQRRELQTHQNRLRKLNVRLENLSEHKSLFLAQMSHELRTPLHAVLGFTQLLEQDYGGSLTPQQRTFVSRIHNAGNFLLQMINDLLDLAKADAGEMPLNRESVRLRETLKSVVEAMSPLAQDNKLRVSLRVSKKIQMVRADPARLRQIVYNLLSNAIKFTSEGGSIRIDARGQDNGFAKISISDTGIGIHPDDHEKIFGKFQQLDQGYSRKFGGTGLGLNLTKRLVELHGGSIWVESEEGKGAKFTFSIPLEADNSEEAA